MTDSKYDFVPLFKTDSRGEAYIIGHAIVWDPKSVRMEFIISHDALVKDRVRTAIAPDYVKMGLAERVEPYPGINVREAIRIFPGGLAYFNSGESGMQINPLIENGSLLTKPNGSRAVFQDSWEPLNGTYTFFL